MAKTSSKIRSFSEGLTASYDTLKACEQEEPRLEEQPPQLALEALNVAPSVFQWRDLEANDGLDPSHLNELVRVLQDTGTALDPLLVSAIGQRFFVIDGHHRLAAYLTAEWAKEVPVEYFEGALEEARDESLRRNSKNKLPMTDNDKLEAAWKMVCQGSRTKKSIVTATTISTSTIANMRRVLRERPDAKGQPWRRVKHLQRTDELPDDWLEQKAQKWAHQWRRNMPLDFQKRPDVMARAIAILNPNLPRSLVYQWVDLAEEVVGEVGGPAEFDV
jgi:hypothetical protein